MLKFLALGAVLIGAWGVGFELGAKKEKALLMLLDTVRFLLFLEKEVVRADLTVHEMFEKAAASKSFLHLCFLQRPIDKTQSPAAILSLWTREKDLPQEAVQALDELRLFLGKVDGEEAAWRLKNLAEDLSAKLPEMEKKTRETQKIAPTLSLLFGAFFVILVL